MRLNAAIGTWPITEPIRTNADIGMENAIAADDAALPDNSAGPDYGMITNGSFIEYANIWI